MGYVAGRRNLHVMAVYLLQVVTSLKIKINKKELIVQKDLHRMELWRPTSLAFRPECDTEHC